jgi:hypothetical protein
VGLAKLTADVAAGSTTRAQDAIAKALDVLVLGGYFEAALEACEALAAGPLQVPRASGHTETLARLAPMLALISRRTWRHGGYPPEQREAKVVDELLRDGFSQFPPLGERTNLPERLSWITAWRSAQVDFQSGDLPRARMKLDELLQPGAIVARYVVRTAQILRIEVALREGDRETAIATLRDYVARDDSAGWNGSLFALSRPMRLLHERVLNVVESDEVAALLAAIRKRIETPEVPRQAEVEWRRLLWQPREPASLEELVALERRIGRALPASYRSFLVASNGADPFARILPELSQAHDVRWFREENQEWIDIWLKAGPSNDVSDAEYFVYGDGQSSVASRYRYLPSALQISSVVDGAVYLLNPEIIDAAGEWEAWLFATWLRARGASRPSASSSSMSWLARRRSSAPASRGTRLDVRPAK